MAGKASEDLVAQPGSAATDTSWDRNGGRQAASRRAVPLAGALAAVGLLAAACGGGPPTSRLGASPDVAQQAAVFVRCMPGHGDPDFYLANPNSNPSVSYPGLPIGRPGGIVEGINPHARRSALPWMPASTYSPAGRHPPLTAAQMHSMVRAAACIRAHCFPGYPDREVRNGHLVPRPSRSAST
jgi:hypothetical protein